MRGLALPVSLALLLALPPLAGVTYGQIATEFLSGEVPWLAVVCVVILVVGHQMLRATRWWLVVSLVARPVPWLTVWAAHAAGLLGDLSRFGRGGDLYRLIQLRASSGIQPRKLLTVAGVLRTTELPLYYLLGLGLLFGLALGPGLERAPLPLILVVAGLCGVLLIAYSSYLLAAFLRPSELGAVLGASTLVLLSGLLPRALLIWLPPVDAGALIALAIAAAARVVTVATAFSGPVGLAQLCSLALGVGVFGLDPASLLAVEAVLALGQLGVLGLLGLWGRRGWRTGEAQEAALELRGQLMDPGEEVDGG